MTGSSSHGQGPQLPRPLDGIAGILLLLRPYTEDFLAVALSLLSALCLIALLGLAHGTLIDAVGGVLSQWFGVGAWILPASGFWSALQILRIRMGRITGVSWPRIIAIELAVLAFLGLASRLLAPTLIESEAGGGGGLIGWGIVYLLSLVVGTPWQEILLLAALLLLAAYGFGFSPGRIRDILEPESSSGGSPSARESHRPLVEPYRDLPAAASSLVPSQSKRNGADSQAAPVRPLAPSRAVAPKEPLKKLKPESATKPAAKSARPKRDKALPPIDIFESAELYAPGIREINQVAGTIEKTLAEFGIPARVISYRTGPTVTQFGVEPGFVEKPGPDGAMRRAKVRVAQISALADDLALALAAPTLRIEAPVPGESYVGIEVPHRRSSVVRLRNVMESAAFQKIHSPLAVALGLDVAGQPRCADLAAMPHLLIGGTTGSGKSVCITTLAACLVTNNPPERLRLVLIDPKMVELVRFNGLPHILGKVETELERIITVLRWCTREMDRRYKLLDEIHARHIDDYNHKVSSRGEGESLPRIVVILDEMADLMMSAPDETERTLIRLAQMARAVGIHLVVATQRPSADIVTGLIKANFPARISFAVASSIESRVILDTPGAESLLGKGDMLYLSPEAGAPVRLQGCFVTDREITRLIEFWKGQTEESEEEEPAPAKEKEKPEAAEEESEGGWDQAPWEVMVRQQGKGYDENEEAEIEEATRVIQQYGRASASLLQRKMRLGYPRAARLMDQLQERGIIGRQQAGGKVREVLRRESSEDDE
jgi:S-DNA-T family DNA segregation ATPase FtsK/SpoIIIE